MTNAEADESGALAFDAEPPPTPRIAIVGRPNVGKSSLVNQLLGEERAIVSDIPGTTRDAIDTTLEWQGREVRLVDTAGLRRRGRVAAGPAAERYSALRALKAIGRADVCVLVLDAQDGLTAQDAHVAGYVVDEGVGLVLAINKWDLVEKDDKTFEQYVAPHPQPGTLPALRAGRGHQRPHGPARRARPGRGPPDRRRAPSAGAHGSPQPHPLRGGLAPPAATGQGPPAALLLRHPGDHRAAHLRALRQRRAVRALQLPAVPREPHPGRVPVRGHAAAPRLPRAVPRGARAARQDRPPDAGAGAVRREGRGSQGSGRSSHRASVRGAAPRSARRESAPSKKGRTTKKSSRKGS